MSDAMTSAEQKACGIVMPISAFGDYSSAHWKEVRDVIERAISEAGFCAVPVWEHSATDIIQGRIVRNLYELPLIVCDISGLNPNVMFELGLRLAFKLPVVLIVDELTKIPFDTNGIEHIIYDSKLHFQRTEKLIATLTEKLQNISAAHASGEYRAFIDTFGAFSTFEPSGQKVDLAEYLAERLDDISNKVSRLSYENRLVQSILMPSASIGLGTASRNFLADVISNQRKPEPDVGWTQERNAQLIQLWEEGKTASEIAELLGGVSRNAVIGKAHRLGLKSRPSPAT